MTETFIHACDKCGDQVKLHILTKSYVCSCGRSSTPIDTSYPEFSARARICDGCKYRNPNGCALLPRPCRIRFIWAEESQPPELCPRFDQLNCDAN